jgi:hypothetical protein
MNRNGFWKDSLLRPQVLIIVAMFSIVAFAFQLRDVQPAEAVSTGFFNGTAAAAGATACASPASAVGTDDTRAVCDADEQVVISNFGISGIPASATDIGFVVQIQAITNDTGTDELIADLSWNGGTNFSSDQVSDDINNTSSPDSVVQAPANAACSNFGRTWAVSELSNANFRVRLTADPGSGDNISIDHVQVQVCYLGRNITAADLNNAASVTVVAGEEIDADVTVDHTNGQSGSGGEDNDYESTSYTIEGQSAVCANHSDFESSGTDTGEFTISTTGLAAGTYDVTFVAYSNDSCSAGASLPFTLTDAVTVVGPAPNPLFPDTCGLDVVLVLDSSGSIDSGELATMKAAMASFVTAFENVAQDSRYAVVDFDTTGTVVQGFNDSVATTNTAINSAAISSGGSTNWDDALADANGLLPDGPQENLVIFATDGNPNTIGAGTSVSETAAVAAAMLRANTIKNGGTRIIGIGIGGDLDSDNIAAITGPTAGSDYFTTGFGTLATTLADLIEEHCTGDLTLQKCVVNDDGGTADATEWDLLADGESNDYSSDTKEGDFDEELNCVEYDFTVAPGTYELSESGGPDNYAASDWNCSRNEGQQTDAIQMLEEDPNSVEVGVGQRWFCTITNDDIPQGSIRIAKAVTDGGSWPTGFTFTDDMPSCNIGILGVGGSRTCDSLEPGVYHISETIPLGWTLEDVTCSGSGSFSINEASASVTITISGTTFVSCTFVNDPPESGTPNIPTAPVQTVVPVQQVAAVQATPVAVVESIRPPATGSGGLRDGGHGPAYALLIGLAILGSATLLASAGANARTSA